MECKAGARLRKESIIGLVEPSPVERSVVGPFVQVDMPKSNELDVPTVGVLAEIGLDVRARRCAHSVNAVYVRDIHVFSHMQQDLVCWR